MAEISRRFIENAFLSAYNDAIAGCPNYPADQDVAKRLLDLFTLLMIAGAIGLLGLIDPPREEAVAAIAECRSAGIAVKMITGDHSITASVIAGQIGLKGKMEKGKTAEEAEEALDKVIGEFNTNLVSSEMIEKAKNQAEAMKSYDSVQLLNRAMNLAYGKLLGDANFVNTEGEKIQAVTPIDVVKTRIQVDDALKGYNMLSAGRSIVAKEAEIRAKGLPASAPALRRLKADLRSGQEALTRKILADEAGVAASEPLTAWIDRNSETVATVTATTSSTPATAVSQRAVTSSSVVKRWWYQPGEVTPAP